MSTAPRHRNSGEAMCSKLVAEIKTAETRAYGFLINSDRIEETREAIVSTATTSEIAARERAVEDAIHSGEMEGLSVSAEFEAEAAQYVSGAIDVDELIARVQARYPGVQ